MKLKYFQSIEAHRDVLVKKDVFVSLNKILEFGCFTIDTEKTKIQISLDCDLIEGDKLSNLKIQPVALTIQGFHEEPVGAIKDRDAGVVAQDQGAQTLSNVTVHAKISVLAKPFIYELLLLRGQSTPGAHRQIDPQRF